MTFHDVSTPKEEVTVKPIEEQTEWESRKLWGAVAKGIREGDFESASREKSRIEVRFFSGEGGFFLGKELMVDIERATPETERRGCRFYALAIEAFQTHRERSDLCALFLFFLPFGKCELTSTSMFHRRTPRQTL